jgi:hypothetical protein
MARLSARPIIDFQNINSFQYANQWIVRAGDQTTLYFQIVNLDSCPESCPQRYILGIGSSNQPVQVRVTFPSIDCNSAFTLIAQQDPDDGSVFSVVVPYTSTPQTGNVRFVVYQGNNVSNFEVLQMMNVEYSNSGSDGNTSDQTFFF